MTSNHSQQIVQNLWNYCNILRADGLSYGDYVEQLTYLLFLKMAHERANRALKPEQIVPEEYSWQKLLDAEGAELETTYTQILLGLAKQPGTAWNCVSYSVRRKVKSPSKVAQAARLSPSSGIPTEPGLSRPVPCGPARRNC